MRAVAESYAAVAAEDLHRPFVYHSTGGRRVRVEQRRITCYVQILVKPGLA